MSSFKPTFVRHIETAAYGQQAESDHIPQEIEELETKLSKVIKAGNAIVNAQTQVERVIAMHDWKEAIK